MDSLPITCKDAKTTFLLARRAERLARPLVAFVDGAWRLSITVTLGDQEFSCPWHISIYVHYATGGAMIPGKSSMPVFESHITTGKQLERAIERMRRLVVDQLEANAEQVARYGH